MDVIFDSLLGGLFRGLEEGSDVDVKAEVGESRRNDLRAAVVPVLPELDDQNPRPPPFPAEKLGDFGTDLREGALANISAGVDCADRAHLSLVAAIDVGQGL